MPNTPPLSSRTPLQDLLKSGFAALVATTVILTPASAQVKQERYRVFDGRTYEPSQLKPASSAPELLPAPSFKNGVLAIPKSKDGHFHISGGVNGYPVVFLVDTGASYIAIPETMASNAGLRTGKVITVDTAAGPTEVAVTQSNIIYVGPFKLPNMAVISQPGSTALLGMGALTDFDVIISGDVLLLKPRRR